MASAAQNIALFGRYGEQTAEDDMMMMK